MLYIQIGNVFGLYDIEYSLAVCCCVLCGVVCGAFCQETVATLAQIKQLCLINVHFLKPLNDLKLYIQELPVAGSAFTYVLTTLGEFPAFITLGFLLMEYALAGAAVARGFSTFFALLCNQPKDVFIVEINADIGLDFFAFAIILLVTAVLCLGVQESSILLSAANIAGILFLVFIAITGFTQASGAVFTTSFFPEDWDGLFQAFATLMFSYVGFDAVANAVEEARRVRDVPKAILGTVGFNAVLYSIMALSLGLMITPAQLLQCVDSVGNPVDVTLCETPNSPAYSVAFVYAFNIHGVCHIRHDMASMLPLY